MPMARLIYSAIASLDGYVADKAVRFDWGEPDEEAPTRSSRSTRISLGP
jgi:hypothetical protein